MISTTNVTVEQRLGMGAAAVVMLSEIIKLKPKLSGRTSVGTVPMLLSIVIGRAANDPSIFTITDKIPIRTFFWWKTPSSAFMFHI